MNDGQEVSSASAQILHSGVSQMSKIMRVTFKDGRPEEEHTIAAFRDSERGCRALAEDGRDLGYFGPEVCQSIILEIRFDDLPSKENNLRTHGSCAEASLLQAA